MANGIVGLLRAPYFRFFNPPLHDKILQHGRDLLQLAASLVLEASLPKTNPSPRRPLTLGATVVWGFTDSLLVSLPSVCEPAPAWEAAHDLCRLVNSQLQASRLRVVNIFSPLILRGHASYFARSWTPSGTSDLANCGPPLATRDHPPFLKAAFKHILLRLCSPSVLGTAPLFAHILTRALHAERSFVRITPRRRANRWSCSHAQRDPATLYRDLCLLHPNLVTLILTLSGHLQRRAREHQSEHPDQILLSFQSSAQPIELVSWGHAHLDSTGNGPAGPIAAQLVRHCSLPVRIPPGTQAQTHSQTRTAPLWAYVRTTDGPLHLTLALPPWRASPLSLPLPHYTRLLSWLPDLFHSLRAGTRPPPIPGLESSSPTQPRARRPPADAPTQLPNNQGEP